MMMFVATGGGGFAVMNENITFDAIRSGGSFESVSVISPAETVTLHVVAYGSGDRGVSVNELPGEALCVNDCGEPQSIVKALALAMTLSLKLTITFELTVTLIAEFGGVVLLT